MGNVHFDAAAEDDLAAVAGRIGVEYGNPAAAMRFIDSIRKSCEPYGRQPEMGELRTELGEGLRSFTFRKKYIVIYRPLDEGIDVLRVIHSARDWRRVFRKS